VFFGFLVGMPVQPGLALLVCGSGRRRLPKFEVGGRLVVSVQWLTVPLPVCGSPAHFDSTVYRGKPGQRLQNIFEIFWMPDTAMCECREAKMKAEAQIADP
jgi:hypothetical protein